MQNSLKKKQMIMKKIVLGDDSIVYLSKPQHGGKRANAGSKPKYNEPTKTISFRVPESHTDKIKSIVKDYLNKTLL